MRLHACGSLILACPSAALVPIVSPLLSLGLCYSILTHLVVCRCIRLVSDELETSDDLSNSEESDHLSSNNTDGCKLLAIHASHLANGLERVRGASCARVPNSVDEVLAVLLESSSASVRCVSEARVYVGRIDLRWRHLLAVGNELGKLETDLGVVDSRRDEG